MELKEHKSALAALATLGVTAVAAGATAFVKIREKRRQRREESVQQTALSAEQQMVYNEAVSQFVALNERIYGLRRQREALQPLLKWMAQMGEKPVVGAEEAELVQLAADIERFLTMQVPFINACLSTVDAERLTYADYVRCPVDGTFDSELDSEPTGAAVEEGAPVSFVLKLGYYFPDSTIAPNPVKAIVLV